MNRIVGFRKMTGLTQKEMAEKLGVTEGTYRNKEKGRVSFKAYEMKIFFDLVRKVMPTVTISDIFFVPHPTQTDVYEGDESFA